MLFRKLKCPICGIAVTTGSQQETTCPHCGGRLLLKDGEWLTADEVHIREWLARLDSLGVSRQVFEAERQRLTSQFRMTASVNDTIWAVLNQLVVTHAGEMNILEQAYSEMARLVRSEGKDPKDYLELSRSIRLRRAEQSITSALRYPEVPLLLDQERLQYLRWLRKQGKLDEVEAILMRAYPTPAALDELRINYSVRAKLARKREDWQEVVDCLESYTRYARQHRAYCIREVNQAPPGHTPSDLELLKEAKTKLGR